MTKPIAIPFGAWEPDSVSFQSEGLTQALNVTPMAGGYGPALGFNETVLQLPAPIKGAAIFGDAADQTWLYAASVDSIYVSVNLGPWTVVKIATSPVNSFDPWRFARFVGKVIAVQPQFPPVGGSIGSIMPNLGGSPPNARVVGVVGNFLVLGDLDDGIDGLRPNRIRWSGFRNPDSWGTSLATQADFNDMPDEGGRVMGIIGREFGTVFQRHAISRMTYVGSPTVFQFDTVEKRRGAIAPGVIVNAGLIAGYIADDGFFLWDGLSSQPIGARRVNEYFRTRLYPGSESYILGAFDPLTNSLTWAYPTDASLVRNEQLVYSLTEDRWTLTRLSVAWLMTGFDIGYTLEQLDKFGSLDALPFSLDDPLLKGGRARMVGFTPAGIYAPLNGPALPAVIETADWQAAPGTRAFINAIRPQVRAMAVTCAVGMRNEAISDAIAYTADSPRAVDGRCPLRATGRSLRFRTSIPANQSWSQASGVEVHVAGEGVR